MSRSKLPSVCFSPCHRCCCLARAGSTLSTMSGGAPATGRRTSHLSALSGRWKPRSRISTGLNFEHLGVSHQKWRQEKPWKRVEMPSASVPAHQGHCWGSRLPWDKRVCCNRCNATMRVKHAVGELSHCVCRIQQEKAKCSAVFLILIWYQLHEKRGKTCPNASSYWLFLWMCLLMYVSLRFPPPPCPRVLPWTYVAFIIE